MSSTENVEDDGSQPCQHIGVGGSSEDVLHGPDPHGAEAAQLSAQVSPESSGSSSGTAQQDTSSVRSFEFDAVLVFANAEKDEKLADEIERKMNGMKLTDGENAPCALVCQYDHARFGGSIVGRPHKLVEECRFVFIVLTENTQSDDILKFTKDEAIGYALSKRRLCVRYLHTQPEGQRTYVIPEGLDDVIPLIWYEPVQRCQKKIIELFRYHRENPLETASHQQDQKPFTGGPPKRLCSRNGNGDVKGHSTEQQAPVQQMSPDLIRITHDSNRMLERWQKELFCQTIAASEAKKTLRLKGCVFITGRSGDGKTSLVYHILTDLKKEKTSFQPYIISEPEDMKHIPRKNSVVFVDNIFGASHLSSILLEKWRVWFQCIEAYVDAGDMYFIATSPCHVRDECESQLENIPVLSYVIDMVGDHSLRVYERENMLTEFLDRGGVKMSAGEKQKAINSSFTLGFPQCCKLFVTSREAQASGADFFQNPYLFLNQQISKLKSRETGNERLAYMILVTCVFEKGKFSSESLNPFSESPTSLENLKQACGIQQSTTLDEIRDAAENLCKMGYLRFNKEEGFYEFTHQSIYDAVCVSFGKKYVPKILELCPLKFLLANTTMSVRESEKHDNIVQIPPVHKPVLVNRIFTELKLGNFRILEHSLFTSRDLLNELTKTVEFKESLNEILTNPTLVLKFALSGMMMFLTASKKYTSLISYVVNTIRQIPEGKGQEIHRDMLNKCLRKQDGEMISIDSHVFDNILDCKDTTDVHKVLLHQCLEGSCSAGDIIIFDKVMKLKNIKPCKNCFQKAIENPTDRPEILIKLLTSGALGYISELDVVEALVKMKKVESLKRVLKSMKWKLSPLPGKQLNVFNVACSSGNFKMFRLLKEISALPDCKDNLLFKAVEGGSREILESLVTKENINCVDQLGRTLLHHACLMKMSELCEFLIQKGLDHSRLDKNGMSALHLAIRYMDKASVEQLIKCGLQVKMGGLHSQSELQRKFSPLNMAARNDTGSNLVEILIREGPRDTDLINFQDHDGMTPLHVAAHRPHGQEMIEELMKYKADHTLRDNKGKTALHRAAEENLPNNIQCLLHHNAKVNVVDRKGKTPLHYVLARRISAENMQAQMDSVNHLLTKGADVSLADEDGNTCIHMAAKFSTPPETCKKVIEKAGSHVGTNKEGMSPLYLLFGPFANLECMNMMILKYPSLLQTRTDKPVLCLALERRSPYSIVETILDEIPCAAETVNWDDIEFPQALCLYKSEHVIHFLQRCSSYFPSSVKFALSQLLCEKGNVFWIDEMWTEGMDSLELEDSFFAEERHQSLIYRVLKSPARISYLISKGASVNIGDEKGNTPLHIAAAQGSVEGIKTLLGADADVSKSNQKNDSVLHVISKCHFIYHWLHQHSVLDFNLRTVIDDNVFQKILQMKQSLFVDRYSLGLYDRNYPINDILSVLLDLKVPLNVTNSQGFTPLHYSACDKMVLDQLVSAGGHLKHRTEDGWSCLHTACMMKDNKEVVNYILDKDISPCVRDVNGIAPLHVALFGGMKDVETLKRLSHCSHDKTACHCEEQLPFLHVAAVCCVKEIVEMLIEQTPDMLFKEDKEGTLPIHRAVAGGDLEIVKLVTEAMKTAKNGGAKTKDGDKVLVDESDDENAESGLELKQLDESTEDVSHFTDQDPSPEINESTDHKQQNLQQFLKPWEKAYHDNTLLHIAARYSTLEVVNFLLKEGFVLNEFDTDGNTPLHYATAYSGSDVVDCLLEAGAKADCVNKEGLTPLLYALKVTYRIKQEAILTLVQHVPEVSVRTCTKMKENALHLLCKNYFCGYLKTRQFKPLVFTDPKTSIVMRLLTMLIDKGCDLNARDEDGQTPLHLAAAADNSVFVDILLDHGAEIDAVDNQGRTPLHRAVEHENKYTIYPAACCLVERGANPHAVVRSGPIVLDILMNIKKPIGFQLDSYKMILQKLNIMEEWKEAMTLLVKNRQDQLDESSGLVFEDLMFAHYIEYTSVKLGTEISAGEK